MTAEDETAQPFSIHSGTDGDPQLIAHDPDADWVVVEQIGDSPARVLRQERAEGEVAYYRGLLGHPAWSIARGPGFVHVFTGGGRDPWVIGELANRIDDPPGESAGP